MPLKLKLTAADVAERAEDVDISALLCSGEASKLDMYSPEERARRELAALATFDDSILEHEEFLEAVTRDVEEELGLIEDIDPRGFDEFEEPDADIAAVNLWLPISDRDVLNMPHADLERRVRTLIAIGDRRRMTAYAFSLRDRLNSFSKQYADTPLGQVPAEVSRERGQLAAIATPLEAALVHPKRAERQKKADAQQDRARELRKRLSDAKAKAHRQREVDMAESPFARMGRL